MSDFEDDIDDQLLELAGATEKKKKRRRHSSGSAGGGNAGSSKKRKAEYAPFFPSAILLLCYVSLKCMSLLSAAYIRETYCSNYLFLLFHG